jgi:hypothetical protein
VRDLAPQRDSPLTPSPVQWREPKWQLRKGYRLLLAAVFLFLLGVVTLPTNPIWAVPLIVIGIASFFWGRELLGREIFVASASDVASWTSEPGSHLALVKVVNDGRELGYDRGILTFEDNAMVFRGSRCSFVIGPQDVNHQYARQWPAGIGGWSLKLNGHAGAVSIGLCPLYLPEDIRGLLLRQSKTSSERFGAFDAAVSAFLDNEERTQLERSYPPAVRAKSYLP